MLNLSRCTLHFRRSENFARVSLLIHGFALFMVYQSSFWLPVKGLCMVLLATQFLTVRNRPFPTVFTELSYYMDQWTLTDNRGHKFFYDQHRILLQVGLFFLMELTQDRKRKVLLVFFDQLQPDDYRILRLMEKIR